MGIITSSTILKTGDSKSNSGYYQIPAERKRAHQEALANATVDLIARELNVLFPPKLGDPPKEIDTERDEEIELRFCEFMKEGNCKESFTALKNCVDEAQRYTDKCHKLWPRLIKCMHANSDYYQPILALKKACEEQILKDILAIGLSEGVLSEEEVATKQADGFWRDET
ncbi:GCK domain [Arabidopsis suecica]|uniref:GCK domain n=1 Tax=Arabidopsis suecica TaxID=45249 RepID=A0A8T2CDK3_ARASU|nr:GCK domain [Arabidopsis suecica]